MILLKLQTSMKEASLEVLKRCRKSYEISQIFAEAPEIVDSIFDAPELVSNFPVQALTVLPRLHAVEVIEERC
jgi:hypothetical protein